MPRRRANPGRKVSPPAPQAIPTGRKRRGELWPLEYMLAIVNDPAADPERRDRLAICAAQYCHPKAGDQGKKGRAAEAAASAGMGSEWGEDLQFEDKPN